jgi:hypothetical protein
MLFVGTGPSPQLRLGHGNAVRDVRHRNCPGQWTARLVAMLAVALVISLEITLLLYPSRDVGSSEASTSIATKRMNDRKPSSDSDSDSDSDSGSGSNPAEKEEGDNYNYIHEKSGQDDFHQVLWPLLRQRLCPSRVPDVSLGPLLFELGRIEFGLAPNASATSDSYPDTILRNRKKTAGFFYDGGFGFAMFLDGYDTDNSVFYAPIWKCANDQIHSYLHRLFNRMADGTLRDKNSLSTGHSNDTYLEYLKIKDLEFMFYEELERAAANGTDGNDDYDTNENNHNDNSYFTFNHTSRAKPCVFAVLRDPISHFLSGYNEVEYRLITGEGGAPEVSSSGENGHDKNKQQNIKLASYTKIPYDASPEKREERFVTFVKNLLKEHPSFAAFEYYKHFASMSRILSTLSRFDLLPGEGALKSNSKGSISTAPALSSSSSLWFLPTIENLTESFPRFLAERCPRMASNYYSQLQQSNEKNNSFGNRNTDIDTDTNTPSEPPQLQLPPMKRMGTHKSSEDGYGTYKAARDVWKRGGPVARALCALHAMDYACFAANEDDVDGRPRLRLPDLCRDVYASQHFVETILGTGTPPHPFF